MGKLIEHARRALAWAKSEQQQQQQNLQETQNWLGEELDEVQLVIQNHDTLQPEELRALEAIKNEMIDTLNALNERIRP